MNPLKYAQMMKYLTRAKKANPDLPNVFPASKAPIPAKTQNVEEIEAINRFTTANPRTEKAGGGMLVQPSADGSRPGYRSEKTFNKRQSGIYTSRNKSTKDYTGQPFVRDSTKNKPLPPNAVRSGESVIFLGENAQANADKFLELTRAKGGDLNELKRLINEANKGFKFVKIKDLQEAAGFSRQTSFNPKDGIYGSLDTLEIKLQKAFDYVMGDPNKPVVDMFDPMSQVKKLVGTSDAPGRYLKGYEPYELNKRIIKVLAAPKSKTKLRKAEGLKLGDLEFRIDNNVKGDLLFAPTKQVSPETKIMDIVDRHIKQGGTKIEWVVKPEITEGGYPSYGDAVFKYKGKEYDIGRLINEAKDDPNFKEFFKAQREYKTLNDKIVTHPKTGEKIRFGNLMKEVYGDSVVPYNVDHYKSILDEPFTSLRVLPRRINTAAGNIKSFNEMDITNPALSKKYSDAGKEMQLKKIGYNYNQSINDLIEAELKLADDVLNKGRVLRKPNEIIESIRKGENYVPDFYSKNAKPGKGFEKQLSANKANILSAFCNSRKKLNSGSGSLTCSMEEIQTNMKKQINEAARASKDGKIPKRFGKLKAVGGAFFGDVALPIEYMFMAPDLVAGDIEGALRSSTAGLFGAGKVDLAKLPPGEGRKYIRHTNAITNFLNNYQSKMMAEDQLKNLNPGDEEQFVITDQLAQAEKNMADIVKDYQGFGYTYQPGEKGLLEGKVAAQKLIRDKVTSDFDKKINKTTDYLGSGEFFKDSNKDLLKENLRSLGGDPFKVTPINNLEDYIKNKGEATAGNTNILFNRLPYTLEQAEVYGVPDIFNTYAGGYAGVETPGSMEKGQEIDMGIKDVRDAYSSLPINMASQLAALEKKEYEEGILKRRLENQLFAGGGIAKLAGVSSGPAPVRGPNPQGLLSLKNRVRNY